MHISRSIASLRSRPAVVIAVGMTIALGACETTGRKDTRDEMALFASLDSAAAPGRNLLWRAHACVQRAQVARTDTLYPATDSVLRADTACSALPLGGSRSPDGWRMEYQPLRDTAGYELRADGRGQRHISLYSRVVTRQLNADAALIHAREGDSAATLSDPVTGSPLPMLYWIGWCLENNQTSRESGIQGYLLHLRPLTEGEIRCLGTPPFRFTADSDEAIISANGMEYRVHYEPGPLEGESLSEPGRDSESGSEAEPRLILEWQYNTEFAMTATPVRYGETGVRSYAIVPGSGEARAWITREPESLKQPSVLNTAAATMSLEVPMCDWMRGTRCGPAHPNPNDGSFGPGLLTISQPKSYPAH
jgi:hypothetical protein